MCGSNDSVQAQSITSLKLFLQEHKKDYIDPSGLAELHLPKLFTQFFSCARRLDRLRIPLPSYLASEFARMTEEDRDRVEQEAQEIISMCSEQIAGLQDNRESHIYLLNWLVWQPTHSQWRLGRGRK